jgi:hypothetical protein
MNFSKNKTAAIAIAIFLMLSMSASTMLIPNVSANTTSINIPTYAYIHAAPNPIGVGQSAYIYIWLNQLPSGAAANNDIRFHNYELTITAPNGAPTTETFAVVSDPTSNQGFSYTPTQVGTYKLNFTFPGQVYNWNEVAMTLSGPVNTAIYIGNYYEPSSASTTLTVQSSPIAGPIGSSPLPTAYWTRPIYGENTAWYTISSNWLGTGAPGYGGMTAVNENMFSGDAVGPATSHVMWTEPLQSGGVVGGNDVAIQGDTYFEGSAYINRFINPIILDGMLYYTKPVSWSGTPGAGGPSGAVPYGPTVCVNLQTGQQIWSSTNVPALSFGYIYDVQDPNEHGVYPPILIATSGGFSFFGPPTPIVWQAYDADTGNWLFNITNVPSGTTVLGPSGEQLIYVLANDGTPTNPQYYLGQWNSSNVMFPGGSPISGTVDASASSAYDWNVSIPALNSLATSVVSPPTILAAYYGNMMLCMNGTYPGGATVQNAAGTITITGPYTYFAINLNAAKGSIGKVLWTQTYNAPPGNITVLFGGADPTAPDGRGGLGVFVESYKETMQYVGYSMATGHELWGPTATQTSLDYYGSPGPGSLATQCAYGKLYSSGYGGILYCYDLTNGTLLWTYGNGGAGNSTNAGLNNGYGDYPTFVQAIGNGIVYTVTSAHTIETPIYKGALARAINATTGAQIWTLSDYTGMFLSESYAIADGYATFFNGYDNQIYSVGRGPSAATVQAPLTAITEGNNVVIQGTVMDVSAGTKQTEQAADFPNGVPVASDASMSQWMGYVYQQQPEPTNFTGVTVTLTAIDPNHNFITLGTATTDSNGLFSYMWQTPQVPGKYTVTATFAGTNGYWPSNAQTAMAVQATSPATPAPTATPTSIANLYFLPVSIAIIIVIVIVGAVLALLMLRKRP